MYSKSSAHASLACACFLQPENSFIHITSLPRYPSSLENSTSHAAERCSPFSPHSCTQDDLIFRCKSLSASQPHSPSQLFQSMHSPWIITDLYKTRKKISSARLTDESTFTQDQKTLSDSAEPHRVCK